LSLFQAKYAIVMPRRLPKRHKRDWMTIASRIVGFFRSANLVTQRFKDSRSRIRCLEHHLAQENFAAIGSHDSHRRDLSNPFVHVEIRRAAEIHAYVGQINRALRIMRKSGQKLWASGNHLVALLTNLRDATR